ncbi:hypothetical protein [Halomonas sp.]|uniref:hypothetical protein n=1 Tax=Halomonas sp. TaxID=1486246 RepID=UPI00384E868D
MRRLTGGTAEADGTLRLPLRLPLRLAQSDVVERLGPLLPWLSGFSERPMATLTTRFPPERLAVGETLVEVLTLSVQTGNATRTEPLAVRFTQEAPDRVQVINAEIGGQQMGGGEASDQVPTCLTHRRRPDLPGARFAPERRASIATSSRAAIANREAGPNSRNSSGSASDQRVKTPCRAYRSVSARKASVR